MNITVDQIKQVVDTLPIGFYAKARVEVQVDPNANTSYFTPNSREIFISAKLIQETLGKIKEEDPEVIEKLVRGQVYHELSHAILTPKSLDITDIVNVFEDERIETLLKDFYMNVDFKWQIKTICDFDTLSAPTTPWEKFYQVVRFRVGEEKYLKIVDEIIKQFADLNWNSEWNEYRLLCIDKRTINYTYELAIDEFYSLIEKDFKKHRTTAQEFKEQIEKAKAQSGEAGNKRNLPDQYENGEQEQQNNEKGEMDKQESQRQDGDPCHGEKGKGGLPNPEELFNTAIDKRMDSEFFKQVESILLSFSKKNSGGGVINTYSGVFNPRSAGREDYRYFDRMAKSRNSGRYGTFHLNLFIDNSGSFCDNATLANQIVCALIELENKYPFFTVDFALCGCRIHKCENKKRFKSQPRGGNDLPAGSLEIVKSMQRKNTFNYNIVLFDGCTDSYYKKVYAPFDIRNTTMIIDPTCQRDARTMSMAKVVVCQNYLEEVKKEILKSLWNALR